VTDRRRMVDREQIAAKLEIRSRELAAAVESRPPMPKPCGYYRGRVLWDELEIDEWIAAHGSTAVPGLAATSIG
jgi:hypothetical protein